MWRDGQVPRGDRTLTDRPPRPRPLLVLLLHAAQVVSVMGVGVELEVPDRSLPPAVVQLSGRQRWMAASLQRRMWWVEGWWLNHACQGRRVV